MSIVDVEYEEIETIPIKEELYDEENVYEERWDSLVSTNIGPSSNENKKCGEVLVGHRGNFTFVCVLCSGSFVNLESFGMHIHMQHMNVPIDPCKLASSPSKLDPLCSSPVEGPPSPENEQDHEIEIVPATETNLAETAMEVHIIEDTDDSDHLEQENDADPDYIADDIKPESKTELICHLCGRSYSAKRSLMVHMRRQHEQSINASGEPEKKPNVGKTNSTTEAVPDLTTMICKYCDQSFTVVAAFREHMSTHTGRRRFVCPHCPKVFASRHNRQSHINTHTGERPYKCPHCPKGFSDGTNLEMHVRVHLRIMKYSCDYCDKRFIQSTEKKLHERTHTGEKPFQCEECGKRFISRVKLTEHGRRHKNIKNYKCQFCSKAFYSSGLLKDHMPVHTNERPFHCNVCGQDFPRRKSLRAHEQLHSNEKKYICTTCGKAFAQCAGLYSHKKSHGEKAV